MKLVYKVDRTKKEEKILIRNIRTIYILSGMDFRYEYMLLSISCNKITVHSLTRSETLSIILKSIQKFNFSETYVR